MGCGPQVGPFPSRPIMGSIRGEGTPPPTNPSRHLKKERSALPLKWLLKEGRGRSPTAIVAAAARLCAAAAARLRAAAAAARRPPPLLAPATGSSPHLRKRRRPQAVAAAATSGRRRRTAALSSPPPPFSPVIFFPVHTSCSPESTSPIGTPACT